MCACDLIFFFNSYTLTSMFFFRLLQFNVPFLLLQGPSCSTCDDALRITGREKGRRSPSRAWAAGADLVATPTSTSAHATRTSCPTDYPSSSSSDPVSRVMAPYVLPVC